LKTCKESQWNTQRETLLEKVDDNHVYLQCRFIKSIDYRNTDWTDRISLRIKKQKNGEENTLELPFDFRSVKYLTKKEWWKSFEIRFEEVKVKIDTCKSCLKIDDDLNKMIDILSEYSSKCTIVSCADNQLPWCPKRDDPKNDCDKFK